MEGGDKRSKQLHRQTSKERFAEFLHKDKVNLVAERASMNAEEKRQLLSGDRFWGIDLERQKAMEKLMHDERKQQEIVEQVLHNKRAQLQRSWEVEATEEEKARGVERGVREREAMEDYMKAFWSSSTSEDIIRHHWKTKPSVSSLRTNKASPTRGRTPFPSVNTTRIETFHKFDPITSAGRRGGCHIQLVPDTHGTVHPEMSSRSRVGIEESIQSVNRLPVFGDPTGPISPLGSAFLSPFRTSQSVLEDLLLEAAGEEGGANGDGLVVPIPLLRELRFVTARGYLFKEAARPDVSRDGKQWIRVYCALWRTSILYMFNTEDDCYAFFSGTHGANTCVGYIDCEIVVSVKESQRSDVMYRGIDLVSPRNTLTLCTDSDVQFTPWLNTFSRGAAARNLLLFNALMSIYSEEGNPLVEGGDPELLVGTEYIEIGSFNAYTLKFLSLIEQSKVAGAMSKFGKDELQVLEVFRLHGVIVGCVDKQLLEGNDVEDPWRLCQLNTISMRSPNQDANKVSPTKSSRLKASSRLRSGRRKV